MTQSAVPADGLRRDQVFSSFQVTVDASTTDMALEAQLSAALARCAAGDRSALRVIYDHEAPRMIGVAMRIVRRRDLAEEAVHDAFVRIWRGAASFDPARGAARSWLYAVLRNRAISILRDESRFISDENEDEAAPLEAMPAIDRLATGNSLRRCLEALDDKPRSAVVLAYAHGLSHGELAGRLGVPLGTAKSWTRRGLLALQECMG